MDRAAFWTVIDDARSCAEDDRAFMTRLGVRLRTLSPQELTQFQTHFDEVHCKRPVARSWGFPPIG